MTKQKENLIETIDDEGKKITFELIDVITVDDREYALLLPPESEEHEHDEHCDCGCEDEIVIMRLKKEGEEFSFEQIEDDDEFEKVAAYIEEIEDETED